MLPRKTSKQYWKAKTAGGILVVLQYVLIPLARLFVVLHYAVEVRGIENLKKLSRPLIIAANHPSRTDAAFLSMLPISVTRQIIPIRFPMAEKYYENTLFRLLFVPFGSYPLYRWAPSLENYMEQSVRLLGSGESLLLFPEGKLTPVYSGGGKPGVSYASGKTGALIVPLHIEILAERRFWRRSVRLTFGQPRRIADASANLAAMTQVAQELVRSIYAL